MFSSNTSQVSSDATFVEDVFSTYLYTGNATARSITNGIDLAGKGGMVWFKDRSQAYGNRVFDTNRGTNKLITTNTTAAEFSSYTNMLTAFNADGFSIGDDSNAIGLNVNNDLMASWTFRKQAKFFDVVTYTGDGTAGRTVSHNLGSVPGCIMVKRTDDAASWNVYHVSLGNTQYIELNGTSAAATSTSRWNNTTPTSTVFTLGTSANVNASGATYVAYLFAHDAGGFGLTGTDNVISCGSFTTDGSGNATVSLGYEPQWVMMKRSNASGSWLMFDNMRGMSVNTSNGDQILFANLSDAETSVDWIDPTSTGFNPKNIATSATYIYIAIRRGPMKTPTSGTSVFTPVTATASNNLSVTAGFPPDLAFVEARVDGVTRNVIDRLRGGTTTSIISLESASTGAEQTYSGNGISFNSNSTGIIDNFTNFNQGAISMVYWMFRRAPSFMDEVCYTGTGSATTFSHNLGVVPELMIFKSRSGATNWFVYNSTVTALKYLILQSTSASLTNSTIFNNTDPTSSVFTLGTNANINGSGSNFVAYLFASCPGVSKVGSYTGSGTTKQIDCGFTGGARFVLIKRTDDIGDWYVWDSARGIVAGNDPYLLLNSTAAEVTNTDYIDTYSAGFEISSTAPAAINANGGTFIFLAIA